MAEQIRTNVLGGKLLPCCFSPVTGFYRDGFCRTGPGDYGLHTVCIEATADFLAFSRAMGNDLTTPIPEYEFPGLQPGDRWCLRPLSFPPATSPRSNSFRWKTCSTMR